MRVVSFSGGKDSLACLHMFREQPGIVAVYVDSGNPFPHVSDFVHRTAEELRVRLHVVCPPMSVMSWQDQNGYPADIVPWDATPMMSEATGHKFNSRLVPYAACCSANRWRPMQKALSELGAKEVIGGSKLSDSKRGVPDGYVDDRGIVYRSPLWDWSDDDVFSYLKENCVDLPPQYAEGADSLDCWCCTAYMDEKGGARFAYLKAHYPKLYEEAKRRLDGVRDTVTKATAMISLEA